MSAEPQPQPAAAGPRILYCHCAYAKVVPEQVKSEVLRRLSDSGVAFDAVPDLCEMAARKDPALKRLAGESGQIELRIAACFPRAVKWLFHGADAPLVEGTKVENMREQDAGAIVERLLDGRPQPVENIEVAK